MDEQRKKYQRTLVTAFQWSVHFPVSIPKYLGSHFTPGSQKGESLLFHHYQQLGENPVLSYTNRADCIWLHRVSQTETPWHLMLSEVIHSAPAQRFSIEYEPISNLWGTTSFFFSSPVSPLSIHFHKAMLLYMTRPKPHQKYLKRTIWITRKTLWQTVGLQRSVTNTSIRPDESKKIKKKEKTVTVEMGWGIKGKYRSRDNEEIKRRVRKKRKETWLLYPFWKENKTLFTSLWMGLHQRV